MADITWRSLSGTRGMRDTVGFRKGKKKVDRHTYIYDSGPSQIVHNIALPKFQTRPHATSKTMPQQLGGTDVRYTPIPVQYQIEVNVRGGLCTTALAGCIVSRQRLAVAWLTVAHLQIRKVRLVSSGPP